MSTRTFRVLRIASCLAALTALTAAPHAKGQSGANQKQVTIRPVLVFSDHSAVPGAGSTLMRTSEGVYMSLHAFGLTPGEAATAWWVFFNSPKKCATTPCSVADLSNPEAEPSLVYATGRIVGADGAADFGAFRAVGDATGAVSGSGLQNARKAEIHLVVRSHGPAMLDDPQLLREQLSSFNGGCPPNTCANLQLSIHEP